MMILKKQAMKKLKKIFIIYLSKTNHAISKNLMILKNYQLSKINLNENKLILLYGKNEGLKNQTIKELIKGQKNLVNYEEREILENSRLFIEQLLTRSLFDNEKNNNN